MNTCLSSCFFNYSPSLPSLPSPSAGFLFFWSVEFPQLFQLFHHYLGIATGENDASSCCGCAAAYTHIYTQVCVVHYSLHENRTEKYLLELPYHIMLNFHVPCQSLHVLQSRVLAGVRCADAQTLQAYSLVCPGKDPREQVHLAHMLGALWLFGLLCADWLGLRRYSPPPFPF